MALDSLTVNIGAPTNWSASKNVTGAQANSNTSSANEAKASIGTAAANNAAGGANELYFAVTSIAASGNASIALNSFTDIMSTSGIVGVRVKSIQIELLSTTQDSVNGTAASSVTIDNTVTNALSAQSHSGWFDNGTEGGAGASKFTIPNGAWLQFGCPNANGVAVDATHNTIKLVNNDSSVAAAVKVIITVGTS